MTSNSHKKLGGVDRMVNKMNWKTGTQSMTKGRYKEKKGNVSSWVLGPSFEALGTYIGSVGRDGLGQQVGRGRQYGRLDGRRYQGTWCHLGKKKSRSRLLYGEMRRTDLKGASLRSLLFLALRWSGDVSVAEQGSRGTLLSTRMSSAEYDQKEKERPKDANLALENGSVVVSNTSVGRGSVAGSDDK